MSLSWSAVSGATSYNVYRNGTKVGTSSGTSYTDTGLTASTAYSYQVSASNSVGEGAKSGALSVTTCAAICGNSLTPISSLSDSTTARKMAFSSWRTLPGQRWRPSNARASLLMARTRLPSCP